MSVARWIRRIRGTAEGLSERTQEGLTEIAVDDSGFVKYGAGGADRELVALHGTQTVTGNKTFSGSVALTSTTSLPNGTTVAMGTGAATPTVGGILHVNTTQTTSAATAKTTLVSYSLPTSSLSANGKAVRAVAWGTCAANGNNKTVTIDIGGAVASTTGAVANNAGTWFVEAICVRTGASAEKNIGRALSATTAAATYNTDTASTAASITIAVTGTNGTASTDIIFEGLVVEALN